MTPEESAAEVANFVKLVKEIKAQNPRKHIAIDVPGKEIDMIAYKDKTVVKELDGIIDVWNLMAYDLVRFTDVIAGHVLHGTD